MATKPSSVPPPPPPKETRHSEMVKKISGGQTYQPRTGDGKWSK